MKSRRDKLMSLVRDRFLLKRKMRRKVQHKPGISFSQDAYVRMMVLMFKPRSDDN